MSHSRTEPLLSHSPLASLRQRTAERAASARTLSALFSDDALALLTSTFTTATTTTATAVDEDPANLLLPLSLQTISHCVDIRYLLGDALPCAFEVVRRLAVAEGPEDDASAEVTDGANASLPPPQ